MDAGADLLVGQPLGQAPEDGKVGVRQQRGVLTRALLPRRPRAPAGSRRDHVAGDLRVQHRVAAGDGSNHSLQLRQLYVLDDVALGARRGSFGTRSRLGGKDVNMTTASRGATRASRPGY